MDSEKEESKYQSCSNIEDLHDSILGHILSFISTKEAVRTSVLSKRWKNIWISAFNLNFVEWSFNDRTSFMKFVERVYFLRDISILQKFTLLCNVKCDESIINEWIYKALRCGVKELFLDLRYVEKFVLPSSLFSCKSLTVLELDMIKTLDLPPSIWFPQLKVMTLRHVIFPDNNSTIHLIMGCPALKELTIEECGWVNPEISQEVNLGVNLTSFNLTGYLSSEYGLYNLPSVIDAQINVYSWGEREVAGRLNKLLEGLCNVKSLKLSDKTLEAMHAEELSPQLPLFSNLTYLELNRSPVNFDSQALLSVLQNSPKLNTLVFREGIWLLKSEDVRISRSPPTCFLSHLKRVKILKFSGHKDELYALKVLRDNAVVLETMVISTSNLVDGDPESSVWKQLKKLSRGSVSCKITLF